MATQRVSRLHKHILRLWLAEHRRTYGGMALEHRALVKALTGNKSNSCGLTYKMPGSAR